MECAQLAGKQRGSGASLRTWAERARTLCFKKDKAQAHGGSGFQFLKGSLGEVGAAF